MWYYFHSLWDSVFPVCRIFLDTMYAIRTSPISINWFKSYCNVKWSIPNRMIFPSDGVVSERVCNQRATSSSFAEKWPLNNVSFVFLLLLEKWQFRSNVFDLICYHYWILIMVCYRTISDNIIIECNTTKYLLVKFMFGQLSTAMCFSCLIEYTL